VVFRSSTREKIKLLCVIGHGENLLHHFINHYKKYVDEIYFIVYETENHNNLSEIIKEIIKNYNNVKIVKTVKSRIYDWEKVTLLYNMIKSENPKDWWVISDIDEFHLYPKNDIHNIIKECELNGWEMVRGGFIDRIGEDGEFTELKENISIWKQFPNAGFFRYPMSNACPNKVCVVKGRIEITPGQHYAKIDGHTTWRWQGWNNPIIAPVDTFSVQVHHFKWDKTSIDRIKSVADINQEYSYSREYFNMYHSLRKSKFKINIDNPDYFFEKNLTKGNFKEYKNWNKLIKKIISV
jgi:hypothetical protein